MIAKYDIKKNLISLNNLFRKAKGQKQPLFFSKIAIIELCGWIEETVDIIIRKAYKKLTNQQLKDYLENKIKNNHGFDYNNNIRSLLIQLVGCVNVEKIESKINPANFQQMKSIIGSLKRSRDEEAHSHIRGTQKILDAPSITLRNFSIIYNCLEEIERELKKYS